MGLASALSTALTGLTAAETTIDVVGNNLANSNTVGFKASEAAFATQFLQTRSLGASPTTNSGGTNPRQTGLGTMVADITPDFSQGTIEISASPTDLAIQGDGFFIVEGGQGEQLYTRNGIFKMNANNEIVTITGNRLLGYGVDDQFQVESTSLQPISIPLGSAAVAQATENVYLEGQLTPTGDTADTAEIIETPVLGDAKWTAPDATMTSQLAGTPIVLGTTTTGGAGGAMTPGGTYQYRVIFADPNGVTPALENTEGMASAEIGPITLAAGEDMVDLANVPIDPTGSYSARNIYRSDDGGVTYNYVGTIADNVTTTYNDQLDDVTAGANATLNTDVLNGGYSYYVTFS
ncbi:MAG TPA: flagellar hook-basal body complex protein, partial [Thermoguttaceae bacterium]|nr:flagellar hook-basal body complex protein [Thermoguttaceae bacterium]